MTKGLCNLYPPSKKINLFQNLFADKKPRRLTCNKVLQKHNLSFKQFKHYNGFNSDSPHRTLQIGDDSYDVNVEEYTATKKAAIEVSDDKVEYKHKDTASFSYNR